MNEHYIRAALKTRIDLLHLAGVLLLREIDKPGTTIESLRESAITQNLRHQAEAFNNCLLAAIDAMPRSFSDAEVEKFRGDLNRKKAPAASSGKNTGVE